MAESGQVPGLDGFLVSFPTCDVHTPDVPIAADCMVPDEENAKDKKSLKGKDKAIDKGKRRARDHGIDGEMLMAVDVEDHTNHVTNGRYSCYCPIFSSSCLYIFIIDTSPGVQAQPGVFNKPRLLERQPTTIVPQPDPPETTSFGVVQGPLSRSTSFIPHPSSICTPTRSMVSPVIQSSNNESFTARSTSNVESFNANDLNMDSGPLSRRSSQRSTNVLPQAAGETDLRRRVPSSKSPSPMKSLKNIGGGRGSRLSLSPVKIDHEATKALQESITSLLGKRPTPEGEDMAGGPADVPNARNGKRARPHRSKVSCVLKNSP
jgi:DNA replication regulator DPB11